MLIIVNTETGESTVINTDTAKQNDPIFRIPQPVKERLKELQQLCENHPFDIPVNDCAKFLNMGADCLRRTIETGNCRFAICANNGVSRYRSFKIPTAAFYLWYTMGIGQ